MSPCPRHPSGDPDLVLVIVNAQSIEMLKAAGADGGTEVEVPGRGYAIWLDKALGRQFGRA